MAWFGEGFSSLKGQITNIVKSVQVIDDDETDQQGQASSSKEKDQACSNEQDGKDGFPEWVDDPQSAGSFLGQEPPPLSSGPSSPQPPQPKPEKEESKITRGIVNFLQNSILPVTSRDAEVQVDLDAAQQIRNLQEANDRLVQNNAQLNIEVASLSRMVQDLESQVAVSQDENANLSTGLEELDIQHQQAIQSVLTVKEDTVRQYETLRVENQALQEKYDELVKSKAEGSKDKERLGQIIKELEEKNSELEEVMGENSALKTTVEELRDELAKCKEYLPPIFENSEEVEGLELRVRELEADVGVLSEARSNLEVEVSNANRTIQALNDSLRMSDAQIRNQENILKELARLKEEKVNWEIYKEHLECKISDLESSNVSETDKVLLISQVKDMKETIFSYSQMLAQSLKECSAERSQLESNIKHLNEDIKACAGQLLSPSAEKPDIKNELEETNKLLVGVLKGEQVKVKELQDSIVNLEEKIRNDAQSHSEQVDKLKNQLKTYEEDLDKLRGDSNELVILKDVFRQKEAELRSKLSQKQEEIDSLQSGIQSREEYVKIKMNEMLEDVKRKKELEKEIVKLNEEMKESKTQLALLAAHNEQLSKTISEHESAQKVKGAIEVEAQELKDKSKEMAKQIDALTRQVRNFERMEAEYNDKCTDYSLLMSKLEQVNKERDDLAEIEGARLKQVKSLQEEVDTLKNQLEYTSQFLKYSERQEAEGQPDIESSKQVTCPNGCTQTMEEINKLSAAILTEQTTNKLLRNEVEELKEKAMKASNQCTTLTSHLVNIEDRYTEELKMSSEKIAELTSLLKQAEERVRTSSNAYTSASIRSNQQVESLSQQVKLLSDHKEKLEGLLSKAEDQAHKQQAAVTNLQAVLQQFQSEKQRDIEFETLKIRQELKASFARNEELKKEIRRLEASLEEAQVGLSAASRLREMLDRKSEAYNSLKTEISDLTLKLEKEKENVKAAASNSDTKVDRNLVKNLIVGYINTPQGSKSHALKVLTSILGFTKEERQKVGLESSSSHHQQSLSEAFVKFLEMESQPKSNVLLPLSVPSSGSSSRKSSHSGPSPSLLLLEGQNTVDSGSLSVGRTPASILKDVLKDRNT